MDSLELRARAERLLARLGAELGLRVRVRKPASSKSESPDLIVELGRGGVEPPVFAVGLCASEHSAAIAQRAERVREAAARLEAIPLVAAPRLGGAVARRLEDQGMNYLDLEGKAFIRAPGILIDRRVGRRDDLSPPPPRPAAPGSPFADRSSLILRHLLVHGLAYSGVRELAAELRLSPALVSRVLRRLKDEGYLRPHEPGGGRLLNVEPLLEDWVEIYQRRARRQREVRLYFHARDARAIMERLAERQRPSPLPSWALSYHAGASLVAPFTLFSEVHVLLDGPVWEESVQVFSDHFGLAPAADEANLILVEPYYRASWRYGVREIQGLPVVSDLQLYLDLQVHPMRGREQAARVLERVLGHRVEAAGD